MKSSEKIWIACLALILIVVSLFIGLIIGANIDSTIKNDIQTSGNNLGYDLRQIAFASKFLKKGTIINVQKDFVMQDFSKVKIDYFVPAMHLNKVDGKTIQFDVPEGTGIQWYMFLDFTKKSSPVKK